MRLQKFLSAAGFCSRRQGEIYIKASVVRVNGKIITELGTKIDPSLDQVEVNGSIIKFMPKLVYIALNKPEGYVTTCKQADAQTIMSLLNFNLRVYPVGRLDKDSSGLLLLTNDGRIHHRLLHPSFDHEKEYEVTLKNSIPDGALRHMAEGLPMMGTKTRPANIKRLSPNQFRIILKEGKNRQIRRMVRKIGNHVTKLKRIRVANIWLGKLEEGKWRYLTDKEKAELLKDIAD